MIIDLYSRKVIGYAVSKHIGTRLVMKAFEQVFVSRGKPEGLLFHSDQGTQYTAFTLRQRLKQHRVQQSFSAPGNLYDIAVAEFFFASIKKENLHRTFIRQGTNSERLWTAISMFIMTTVHTRASDF